MKRLITITAIAALSAGTASAVEGWQSQPLYSVKDGKNTEIEFKAATPAKEKWKLCALVPHMKDGIWVAADYGLVEEARRLGVALTIYQAGGYDQLPKQISQYDDCIASKPDAILVAPISEAGLAAKMTESTAAGIPTIVFINPVGDAPATSKIFVDFSQKGYDTGKFLLDQVQPDGGKVVGFPGPQGAGWPESYVVGFEKALKDSNLEILDVKYGDPSVAVQLRLVEDALQSYPDVTAIWAGAPAAEAASGAVVEAGRDDIKIVGSYENTAMLPLVKNKQVLGFSTEFAVMQAKIAVDLAVSAIQKETIDKHYMIVPKMVTSENVDTVEPQRMFAPLDWQPVFTVE